MSGRRTLCQGFFTGERASNAMLPLPLEALVELCFIFLVPIYYFLHFLEQVPKVQAKHTLTLWNIMHMLHL